MAIELYFYLFFLPYFYHLRKNQVEKLSHNKVKTELIWFTHLFWVLVNFMEQTGHVGPMFNFFGFDMKLSRFPATSSVFNRNMSNRAWTSATWMDNVLGLSALYSHSTQDDGSGNSETMARSSSEKCRATCSRAGSLTSQMGHSTIDTCRDKNNLLNLSYNKKRLWNQ